MKGLVEEAFWICFCEELYEIEESLTGSIVSEIGIEVFLVEQSYK